MRDRRRPGSALFALVAAVAVGAGGAGCAKAGADPEDPAALGGEIAKVEPAAAPGQLPRVILAPKAVERLGVGLGQVLPLTIAGAPRTVVPYGAVIYDANGGAFVYTVPEPNSYVRAPVTVVSVAGDQAVVDGAPPVGTQVVAVGAAEIFGAETGVGDE